MTEESKDKDTTPSGDVSSEWHELGQNLKDIFQGAWESDERRKLQENIEAGLADFASSVNKAVEEFKVSPTGQQLRADVEDFRDRVKSGDVENKARQELESLLRSINSELEKVSKQGDTENKVEGDDVEES